MGKPRDLANVVATGNILADGAVAPAELTGVTSTAAEINILDGVTATAAELNILDGVTATTAELNYVDGVTSNVQTQIDTKAPVASPTFTGTATAPTVNASTALQIGGVAVTATAAELNKMDGVTVSASDINSVTAKAPTASPTFTGDVTIPDKIVHDGDTNTAIRFPAADTVSVETSGSEAMRIDSSGNVIVGETSTINGGNINLATSAADATLSALCRSTTDSHGVNLIFQKSSTDSGNFAATADGENLGKIIFRGVNTSSVSDIGAQISVVQNGTDSATVPADMVFTTKEAERMRIDANGDASFTEELIAKSYNETYVSLSAAASVTIDCETGNVFALTTGQNTTFVFSNPPASGTAYGFTLKLTSGGSHTITYPNSVDFAGGTAPDAPASGETDVLVFFTIDGGTNWYGALAIDAAG
jgi:hypothetical protein